MSPIVTGSSGSTLTFKELQDQALGDSFAPTKYRTLVKQWLNEGEREIFRRARLPESEGVMPIATVAGEDSIDLEEILVIRVNSLRLTDDRRPLDQWTIEEIDAAPAASGKPYAFAIVGNLLTFYPTPDREYDLQGRFQARPGQMVNDDDEPTLQIDYQSMLVTFARRRLFREEDDFEMANGYKAEFEEDLTKLRRDVGRRSRSSHRQVPGMFASTSGPSFVRPA